MAPERGLFVSGADEGRGRGVSWGVTVMVRPVPADGPALGPYLIVRDAAEAIGFYERAFGAREVMRLVGPAETVAHAEIALGGLLVMLAEEAPHAGNSGPETLGGSPVRLHLYVEDVDAVVERAVAAGAEVLIPVADQFYGDRAGRLADPFGHVWIVASRKEDLTPEVMQQRFEELLRGAGGG